MTFENLAKIVDAKLLNQAAVKAYEKIETKAYLIKRGDLFIGSQEDAINQAIENGAYGILCDNPHIRISDDEIAWLYVSQCDSALIKLLRFSLLQSTSGFVLFTPVQYAILKQLAVQKNVIFLEKEMAKNFKKIQSADNESCFIASDQTLLQEIAPDYTDFSHHAVKSKLRWTHQSLFLSSFIYQDTHYEDIKLPALFLADLNIVLHFLEQQNIAFNLEKLHFLEFFHPLFISNRLAIRPFGQSEHAFIVNHDHTMIPESVAYIQNHAKWSKILLFLPVGTQLLQETNTQTTYYHDLSEIKSIEVNKFNFILILANYNDLHTILEQNNQEKNISLFQE